MTKKKFNTISPCELTTENMDRCCALDSCPNCDYDFSTPDIGWFRKVKIICICEAPFAGGFNIKRTKAIVYECPNCFNYFWFHTDIHTKETLENLLNNGIIKK